MRTTQTQCRCPTTFTSTPTGLSVFTQTHTQICALDHPGSWCLHAEITCATAPHASFHPRFFFSPFFFFFFFSHSHFCLAVGHKVGLCGEEVLAVAVASAAVELVRLQHGTLGPLVPVGLPPAHRLSPVPTLQPLPHPMPGCDCVGTVCQWAAHCSRAGAKSGLGGPGDTQGRATWHGPRHVCQGGSSESWRLATVAVSVSVGAVGAVSNEAMAAFWFLAVRLQSPNSSSTSYVSFCWEGGDGGDVGHLCDVGGHWLWGQRTKGSHRSQGGHRGEGSHGGH